jgi:hypothetical protein
VLRGQVFADLDDDFAIRGGQSGPSGSSQGIRVELETVRGLVEERDVVISIEKLNVVYATSVEPHDALIVPE